MPIVSEEVKQAAASGSITSVLVQTLLASSGTKTKKNAHRPLKKISGVLRVQGATVITNIAKFSSLGDFLQNGLLDDEWLFAVPPRGDGRPYDFLESLLAGEIIVPWKVMTYRDYLRAMHDAAKDDEAALETVAEASILAKEFAQPNS